MEMKAIIEARKELEQLMQKAMDNFELRTGCKIDGIVIKRRHIDAGIASRDALDKITVKASLPEDG
jgi:hypothetical protein